MPPLRSADDLRWDHIEMFDNMVLIRQLSEEEKKRMRRSIIITPDGAKDELIDGRGVVVAIGPGSLNADGSRNSMRAKIGDMVMYRKSGIIMRENDCNCYIVRDLEICCRIMPRLDG